MNCDHLQPPLEQQLPLSEPVFYILLSLASGQKHGYAILKDVESLSQGKLLVSTSTLYGAISRLQDQGWIEHIDVEVQLRLACRARSTA